MVKFCSSHISCFLFYNISVRLMVKQNCKKFQSNKNLKKVVLMMLKEEKKGPKLRLHEIANKLSQLVASGKISESIYQENFKGHLESTMHVAVIFSKLLPNDQITIEFERRISTILTQINLRKFKPDIIAFIGGHKKSNPFSGAFGGYIYFRYLSNKANIDLKGLKFIIEETTHNSQENLIYLLNSLKKEYGEEAISKCHFTLISSDYHLIRIAEIYKLSRRPSLLSFLYKFGVTWTFLFATYPFCVSSDQTLAFLGRIRVLANDLTIVLVNLNELVKFNDLMAKENFCRLCETYRKLKSMMRIICEPRNVLNSFEKAIEIPSKQLEVLERSISTIHEVQMFLTPLMNGKNVDRRILIRARDLLMSAVKDIRLTIDPDRPLSNFEWENSIFQLKNKNYLKIKKKKEFKIKKTKKFVSPFLKQSI
jgi:hypothetical protein